MSCKQSKMKRKLSQMVLKATKQIVTESKSNSKKEREIACKKAITFAKAVGMTFGQGVDYADNVLDMMTELWNSKKAKDKETKEVKE